MEGPQLFSEAKSPFVEGMTMTQKSIRTSATRDEKPYKIAFFNILKIMQQKTKIILHKQAELANFF
jgi:hypothetical protein